MPERGTISDRELSLAMRTARERGGFRQEDLAGPVGVSVSRISSWESESDVPRKGFKVLHYMAELLRRPVSRDALLRELAADEGLAPIEDPELQRRLDLVRRAYRKMDRRVVRSAFQLLEDALLEDEEPAERRLKVAEEKSDYGEPGAKP